jgi:hypothetical protein
MSHPPTDRLGVRACVHTSGCFHSDGWTDWGSSPPRVCVVVFRIVSMEFCVHWHSEFLGTILALAACCVSLEREVDLLDLLEL